MHYPEITTRNFWLYFFSQIFFSMSIYIYTFYEYLHIYFFFLFMKLWLYCLSILLLISCIAVVCYLTFFIKTYKNYWKMCYVSISSHECTIFLSLGILGGFQFLIIIDNSMVNILIVLVHFSNYFPMTNSWK